MIEMLILINDGCITEFKYSRFSKGLYLKEQTPFFIFINWLCDNRGLSLTLKDKIVYD